MERQSRQDLAEPVEDRVEVRGVEGVADPELTDLASLGPEVLDHVGDGGHVSGDDRRVRTVDGGDARTWGQGGLHLFLGGVEGGHRARGVDRLHQAGAGGDERRRVGQVDDTGDVRGGDLADGVAEEQVRDDAVELGEPVEGDLLREQHRLGPLGPAQQFAVAGEGHLAQRPGEVVVEMGADLVEGRGEHRVVGVELGTGTGVLAALTGEQERQPPGRRGVRGRDRALGEGVEVGVEWQRGAVLEVSAGGGQRVRDPDSIEVRVGAQERGEVGRTGAQRVLGPGGEQKGDLPRAFRCRGGLALLQDDVGVRAADTEGRHGGPARAPGGGPPGVLGGQCHRARGPVDVLTGRVDVQRGGNLGAAQRLDRLDHSGDACRGLGVAEVGLDRAEQQRVLAVLAVGGEHRLRLDRVAQRGAGAVRFENIHIGRRQSGRREGLADDPLL